MWCPHVFPPEGSSSSCCGLGSRRSFSTRSDKTHKFSEIYLCSTPAWRSKKAASRGLQFKKKQNPKAAECTQSPNNAIYKASNCISTEPKLTASRFSYITCSLLLRSKHAICPRGVMLRCGARRIWKYIPENRTLLYTPTDTRTLSVQAKKATVSISPLPASATGRQGAWLYRSFFVLFWSNRSKPSCEERFVVWARMENRKKDK